MPAKAKFLQDARLYLVLDRQVVEDEDRLFEILKQAVKGGVDLVQLRDKNGTAKDILAFSRRAVKLLKGRIPLIINDRPDLAKAAGAQGVHVGQEDVSVELSRRILGPKAIIGVSCQTLAHARKAQNEGADYIGFGSVFKTLTKPSRSPMDLALLAQVVRESSIPVFAIGGIELENVPVLLSMGVKRVAVTRAICLSRDAAKAAEDFCGLLRESAV
jgi:thiamine-phosphate pyrophosphorylase